MAKFVPKVFEDILQRMVNKVVARSRLSDLNETSSVFLALSAFARELDDLYFQGSNLLKTFSIDKAAGEDLDERALDFNPDIIVRRTAVQAVGEMVFSRLTAGAAVPIAAGFRIEVPNTSPAVVVVTTAAGSIPMGDVDSAPIAAIAEVAGSRGNAAANTLTKFKGAKPSGVDSVTNPNPFTSGQDRETDDSFRQRIKAYTRTLGRGTKKSLEEAALAVALDDGQRVVFAKAVKDPVIPGKVVLYVDDGAGSAKTTDDNYGSPETLTSGVDFPGDVAVGGEHYLYSDNIPIDDEASLLVELNGNPVTRDVDFTLNPTNGQFYFFTALSPGDSVTAEYSWLTGLLAEVQKVIDGDPDDRLNYPGYAAAGDLVLVDVPTILGVVISAGVVVLDGFDATTVRAAVASVIASYVNTLGIGNDLIVSEMIERAMSVPGVFDFRPVTPTENLAVLEDTLIRVNVPDISLS